MLGGNKVAKINHGDGYTLRVHSLFYTIQGEGPHAGRPALFLRLSGCNLRCVYCDTSFEGGVDTDLATLLDQIAESLRRHRGDLLVITGGEPLLQNVMPLVRAVNELGHAVSIETSGTVYLEGLDERFRRAVRLNLLVCSPKTPKIDARIEPLVGAYKYIVAVGCVDPVDGLPNRTTQSRDGLVVRLHRRAPGQPSVPIYLQPMDEGNSRRNTANMRLAAELCMKHHYRLSVQVHKIVGVE